jgi:hypothetical protein
MMATVASPFSSFPFSFSYTDGFIIGGGWGHGNPRIPRFSPSGWADMIKGLTLRPRGRQARPLHVE